MPQFARPDSTITIGEFTDQGGGTTNIHLTIDESAADDGDFIRSAAHNAAAGSFVYACGLSNVTDPVSSSGHIIRMRTATDLASQEPVDFTQQLRQGYVSEGVQGTLIASQARNDVTSVTWTTSAYTLSGAEADAITDYTDLQFRFVLTWT